MPNSIQISGATTGVKALALDDKGRALKGVSRGLDNLNRGIASAKVSYDSVQSRKNDAAKALAKSQANQSKLADKAYQARLSASKAQFALAATSGYNRVSVANKSSLNDSDDQQRSDDYRSSMDTLLESDTYAFIRPEDRGQFGLITSQNVESLRYGEDSRNTLRDAQAAVSTVEEVIDTQIANNDLEGALHTHDTAVIAGTISNNKEERNKLGKRVEVNQLMSDTANATTIADVDAQREKAAGMDLNAQAMDRFNGQAVTTKKALNVAYNSKYTKQLVSARDGTMDEAGLAGVREEQLEGLREINRMAQAKINGARSSKTNFKYIPQYTAEEYSNGTAAKDEELREKIRNTSGTADKAKLSKKLYLPDVSFYSSDTLIADLNNDMKTFTEDGYVNRGKLPSTEPKWYLIAKAERTRRDKKYQEMALTGEDARQSVLTKVDWALAGGYITTRQHKDYTSNIGTGIAVSNTQSLYRGDVDPIARTVPNASPGKQEEVSAAMTALHNIESSNDTFRVSLALSDDVIAAIMNPSPSTSTPEERVKAAIAPVQKAAISATIEERTGLKLYDPYRAEPTSEATDTNYGDILKRLRG